MLDSYEKAIDALKDWVLDKKGWPAGFSVHYLNSPVARNGSLCWEIWLSQPWGQFFVDMVTGEVEDVDHVFE